MKLQYKVGIAFVLLTVLTLIWRMLKIVENDKSSMKFILIWTSPNADPLEHIVKGQQAFILRNCPVNNCYVTPNKTLLTDLTYFDAILFHCPEIFQNKSYHPLPKKRSQRQIYVFVSQESSNYYPAPDSKLYDNYFNMTWTYRLDSDVYFGYVVIRNDKGEVIGPSDNIQWLEDDKMLPANEKLKYKLRRKKKTGAWFVSNCYTPSFRSILMDELKRELKKYNLSIDIYGECGSKRCSKYRMDYCLDVIEKEYFFYFALENSFSTDYVTEKLLSALNHYAVPVVYGGADYKRFMPDGIYLDATKLSKKELAQQIYRIINDKELYHQYFKWHNHYSYESIEKSPETDPYCKLCEYLNTWKGSKVVRNLTSWWNDKKRWTEMFENLIISELILRALEYNQLF